MIPDELVTKIVSVIKKYGVKSAGLFGSVVEGEDTPESDVDILIEPTEGTTLLDIVALKLELEQSINRTVDILTYDSIHPLLKKRILQQEVRIYEA